MVELLLDICLQRALTLHNSLADQRRGERRSWNTWREREVYDVHLFDCFLPNFCLTFHLGPPAWLLRAVITLTTPGQSAGRVNIIPTIRHSRVSPHSPWYFTSCYSISFNLSHYPALRPVLNIFNFLVAGAADIELIQIIHGVTWSGLTDFQELLSATKNKFLTVCSMRKWVHSRWSPHLQ